VSILIIHHLYYVEIDTFALEKESVSSTDSRRCLPLVDLDAKGLHSPTLHCTALHCTLKTHSLKREKSIPQKVLSETSEQENIMLSRMAYNSFLLSSAAGGPVGLRPGLPAEVRCDRAAGGAGADDHRGGRQPPVGRQAPEGGDRPRAQGGRGAGGCLGAGLHCTAGV
jgi:hypothetical protein